MRPRRGDAGGDAAGGLPGSEPRGGAGGGGARPGPAGRSQADARVVVPGRMELRGHHPLEIWDGAHNPAGMRRLVAELPALLEGRRTVAVFSTLGEKDVPAMVELLRSVTDTVIATESSNDRVLRAPDLAPITGGRAVSDPVAARAAAIAEAGRAERWSCAARCIFCTIWPITWGLHRCLRVGKHPIVPVDSLTARGFSRHNSHHFDFGLAFRGHYFFHSGYVVAGERLMVIFVVALYLALVFWTAKDARRRIEDPVIVGVCIATAALFPFVGVLVYLILRPPEYLADVHERELEIRAMERRLGADPACPYCRNPADASFLSCPYCGTKLKQRLPPVQDSARCRLAAVPALRDAGDHRAADTAGPRHAGEVAAIDARRADAHTWLKSSARS